MLIRCTRPTAASCLKYCVLLAVLFSAMLALAYAQTAPPDKDTPPKPPACEPAPSNPGKGATAFVIQQPASPVDENSPTRLKDVVPLLQSMVWALLIAAIAVGFRTELAALLRGRHFKFEAAGVSVEVLPPEQVTDPMELEIQVE